MCLFTHIAIVHTQKTENQRNLDIWTNPIVGKRSRFIESFNFVFPENIKNVKRKKNFQLMVLIAFTSFEVRNHPNSRLRWTQKYNIFSRPGQRRGCSTNTVFCDTLIIACMHMLDLAKDLIYLSMSQKGKLPTLQYRESCQMAICDAI